MRTSYCSSDGCAADLGTPAEHVAAGAIDADSDWAFHARELLGEALGTHAAPPLCLFFRPGNEVIQIDDIAFSKDARALLRVEAEQVKQQVAHRFFLHCGSHRHSRRDCN